VKRFLDLTLASVGLVVLSPLLVALWIVVRLSSPGPAIFRQQRLGRGERPFTMYKFRSMHAGNSDAIHREYVRQLMTDDEPPTGETHGLYKLDADPRVTRIGGWLRRSSLDELPQLVNVVRGDMSLVGPRPERPYFVDQFKQRIPQYMLRHKVRAGLTGWAQVNGWRGNTSIEKRIEYDLYYIENWSVALDIKIMWLTLVKGFFQRHAY
jgi:exopolysaccharide biosynthesis polyprenyl glycosylphosphotransferase